MRGDGAAGMLVHAPAWGRRLQQLRGLWEEPLQLLRWWGIGSCSDFQALHLTGAADEELLGILPSKCITHYFLPVYPLCVFRYILAKTNK